MSVDSRLDTIAQLREELRIAKPKAMARAREIAAAELNKLEAMLNAACRIAHDEGASYAAIGRALGTKDFGTVKRRVGSTSTEVVTAARFEVRHNDFGEGTMFYNGTAVIPVKYMDTGVVTFDPEIPEPAYSAAVKFAEENGLV